MTEPSAIQPTNELDHLDQMAEQHAKDADGKLSAVNQLVVSLLPPIISPQAHILDFGCGAGRISLLLGAQPNVASVLGTDIRSGMMEQANKLLQAKPNPKVSFRLTSRLPDLEAFQATKDLVVMSFVLGHIHPKQAGESVVAAAVSTLKKGGQFALAEFVWVQGEEAVVGDGHDHSHNHSHTHGHDNHNHDDDKSHHGGHVAYTEEEIRQLFAKVGLEAAPQFTPFEFDWGDIATKCIMAVGTKV